MGNIFTDIYHSTMTIETIVQKINGFTRFGSIEEC